MAIQNKYPTLVAIVEKNQALFTQLSHYASPSQIPPALLAQGIRAAGGTTNLLAINAIKPQLAFLQVVGPHLLTLQAGANASPAEWQHWLWVCFGGIALFLPLIFVMKGRWNPKRAREDEEEHERFVEEELARMHASG